MILRHSQLSTTMDVYVTVFRENLQDAADRLDAAVMPRKKPGGTTGGTQDATGTDPVQS